MASIHVMANMTNDKKSEAVSIEKSCVPSLLTAIALKAIWRHESKISQFLQRD